tara:strand:- start:1808 stop:2725 length:918 start_codon:yes stop_codon:yes gene_type:complete
MKNELRHFLDIDLINTKTVRNLLLLAHNLKKINNLDIDLDQKILAMIFEKPSTRTRVSFEIGMKQMNGEVVILDQNDTQLGRGESIEDTIKVLSNYVDIIMYRGSSKKRLSEIVTNSTVPIINGLTDLSHPCQIMADLMTLEENFESLNKLKICWVGDGNNVCNSWIHACNHFNFKLNIATPQCFQPKREELKKVNNCEEKIEIFSNPNEAIVGADVVITDTWFSMGLESKNSLRDFEGYQINKSLMNKAKPNAFFLHCLPAHRGQEVTDEVIDGPNSLVWEEAKNRLFTQKAILIWCLRMENKT